MTRKESQMGTERQVMQDYVDALIKRANISRHFASALTTNVHRVTQL
jgi:hypothetical protein